MLQEIYNTSFINELEKIAVSHDMKRIILQRKLNRYVDEQKKNVNERFYKKAIRRFIIKRILSALSKINY
jgi:transcription elongation factor GreA-like protein